MSVLFHLAIKRLDCTSIRGCTISNAQGATATMHIIRSDGNGRCGAIPHRSRLPTIKIVFESAVDDQFDGFIGRRRSHSDSRWKYSPHATQHGCSRSSNHTTGFPCLQYVNVINHSVPFPGMMEGDSPPHHFFFAAQSNPTLVTTTSRLIAKPCQRNVPQGQPCNSHYINERISLAIVLDNKLITICTMKISSHKRNATHQI